MRSTRAEPVPKSELWVRGYARGNRARRPSGPKYLRRLLTINLSNALRKALRIWWPYGPQKPVDRSPFALGLSRDEVRAMNRSLQTIIRNMTPTP
jgi:hypothetical protein